MTASRPRGIPARSTTRSGAPTTTWEDWLNESFAEYASWMWVRETRGPEPLAARLEKARKRSQGMPPVWGIDRDSEAAYTVLYARARIEAKLHE